MDVTYLEGNQHCRDADLRGGTDISRSDCGPRRRVKDPGDPVGLGEQGAVHGAETDADAETLQHAGCCSRRSEQQEGVQVADQHACQ